MSNRHLIAKQIFDLQLVSRQGALAMQQDLSRLYWEQIVPALERLFDELAPSDELLRIDKLEIDLGLISERTLRAGTFIDHLLEQLSVAIAQALEKNTSQAIRSPLRLGLFELWLYFLEHGTLPSHTLTPDSRPQWHRQILDTLALEADAVERLHQLLQRHPPAFERLILQYDQFFLQQIIRLFTGHRHDELPIFIHQWAERMAALLHSLLQLRDINSTAGTLNAQTGAGEKLLIQRLQKNIPALQRNSTWAQRFIGWLRQHPAAFRDKMPQQLQRQIEMEWWHGALREVILLRKKWGTVELFTQLIQQPTLAHWNPLLLNELRHGKWEAEITPKLIQEIKRSLAVFHSSAKFLPNYSTLNAKQDTTQPVDKQALDLDGTPSVGLPDAVFLGQQTPITKLFNEPKQTQPVLAAFNSGATFLPQASKGTAFFVKNAGIVLVHAFLPHFFRRLELCEGNTFKTGWHQQKALYLLHYLATKTVQVPEYELVLPKFICGVPLNQSLDHSILLSEEEQMEAENLLAVVIERWGALGSVSPDSLREGFLQREGRLEKRSSAWFLQVETNTIDLLLGRLPWNLSLIKLPWMEELLSIEWH